MAEPLFLDGDPAPGMIGVLDNLDRPNVNDLGLLAFTADMIDTVDDDLLIVNGVVLAREGDPAPGVVGASFGGFDQFKTYRHINATGDVVFISPLIGVPSSQNQTLYRNLNLVFREGDAAPGLVGRTFQDFDFAAILDDASVVFRADLDGTVFDRAIYRDSTPLLIESDTIRGTAFDGSEWDEGFTSFTSIDVNGVGDIIFVGDTTVLDPLLDEGLFRLTSQGVLELLVREGDVVAANTGLETVLRFGQSFLSETGDWVMRGQLDTAAEFDDFVIGSIGGSTTSVLTQEGDPIPEIPGATLGAIQGATLNPAGSLLTLAEIVSSVPFGAPTRQGLFLDGALLLMTGDPVPGVPGATLTAIGFDQILLNSAGVAVFEATLDDGSSLDGIFRAVLPPVLPVTDVTCTLNQGGTAVDVSWSLPAGAVYDGIRVFVDGLQVANISATQTSLQTAAIPNGTTVEVCVQPYFGTDQSRSRCCSAFVLAPPDFEQCSVQSPPFPVDPMTTYGDTLNFLENVTVATVEISVNVDHSSSFLAGINPLEVTSPAGTTVRLHDGNGSGPSLRAIYSDAGRANGPPFEAGDLMQPTGPGNLDDWRCELSGGNWVFSLSNSSGISTPIVEDWCVRVFEQLGACIDPISNLSCVPSTSGQELDVSWSLPPARTYSALRVFVDGALESELPGNATSYQTAPATQTGVTEVCVAGLVGTDESDPVCCSGFFVVSADFDACSVPASPVMVDVNTTFTDVLGFVPDVEIGEVQVTVEIGHTTGFIAGIDPLELTSPSGTTVRLHDGNGANDPLGLRATYSDRGRPNGPPFSAGDPIRPTGPGTMADFSCEMSAGNWVYELTNSSSLSRPIQESWCLGIFEETNPGANCCEPPSELTCVSDLCDTGAVLIQWTLGADYDELELIRDPDGTPIVIPLSPTDTSYADFAAPAGSSYSYLVRGTCLATSAVVDSPICSVSHDVAPIQSLQCIGDICSGTVSLSWDNGGLDYTNVALLRDDVFLSDVTFVTSFTDTPPSPGDYTYTVQVTCGVDFGPDVSCAVSLEVPPPANLSCDAVPCGTTVELSWDLPGEYDELLLLRDGVAQFPLLQPNDTQFTNRFVPSGRHVYTLIASCGDASTFVECETLVIADEGQLDLVLQLEGPDDVNSAQAIADALTAMGRTPLVLGPGTDLLNLPCGIQLDQYHSVWVCAGTFPQEYDLSTAEGDALAAASALGTGLYLEGGDLWGFGHAPSALDDRDGIEVDSVLDGDDGFLTMDGFDSGLGADLSAFVGVPYYQPNQSGNDFTDELVLSGTSPGIPPDAEVTSAAVLWRNSTLGDDFITGVVAIDNIGTGLIACSWEFGGFGLDPADPAASDSLRQALLAEYALILGVVDAPMDRIIRGDANQDGIVDLGDAIYVLGHVFPVPPELWMDCHPPLGVGLEDNPNPIFCVDAADGNDDEILDVGDVIAILQSLFGDTVPMAFPNSDDGCGFDPDSPWCEGHAPGLASGYRVIDFGDLTMPGSCRFLTNTPTCP